MENKNTGHIPMSKKEKAKVAVSLLGVGALTAVAYWAQTPAVPLSPEDFQTNIAGDNEIALEDDITSNDRLVAQADITGNGSTTDSVASPIDATRKALLNQYVQAIEAYNADKNAFPKPESGQYSCTIKLTELKEYFPEGSFPTDPALEAVGYNTDADATKDPKCEADEGVLYVLAADGETSFDYMVMSTVKEKSQGNLAKEKIKTDGTAIPEADLGSEGDFYVIVKSSKAAPTADDKKSDLFAALGIDENAAADSTKSGDSATDTPTDTDTTDTPADSTDTKTDTTDLGSSRFGALGNDTAAVSSTDLGGSSDTNTAAKTSGATQPLPETGVPLVAYAGISLLGAAIMHRKKQ